MDMAANLLDMVDMEENMMDMENRADMGAEAVVTGVVAGDMQVVGAMRVADTEVGVEDTEEKPLDLVVRGDTVSGWLDPQCVGRIHLYPPTLRPTPLRPVKPTGLPRSLA